MVRRPARPRGCAAPVGGHAGADALEHRRRRLDRVGGQRQHRQGVLVLADVALAGRARREVLQEDLLVLRLQRRERVPDGQLLEAHVVVRAGHVVPLGSVTDVQPAGGSRPPAALDRPSSDSFIRRMPASMRVFTVPSGVAVSPAISRCV